MNKTLKRLNVFLLLLVLVLAINQGIFFLFSEKVSNEKVLCTATIEDNFDDETVLLALSNEESMKFKKYSTADFKDVDCASVEEITESLVDKIKKQQSGIIAEDELIIDTTKFQRIFEITLKKKGKENVLKAIKTLEKKDDIYCVEPNYQLSISEDKIQLSTEYEDLGDRDYWVEAVGLDYARGYYGTDAKGIKVGIIDTGIADHDALIDCIDTSKNALHKDFTGGNAPLNDVVGHGTFIAGIIGGKNEENNFQGVCENVSLVSLKVANQEESFNWVNIIDAIQYATDNDIPILNISLGWYDNPKISEIIYNNYPGLIISSAGNKNLNTDVRMHFPSGMNCENIIAIGAIDKNNEKSSYSNYGKTTVDLFAPGDDIFSTYLDYGYAKGSGTSFSTPIVTATAALLLANYPKLTTSKLKELIFSEGLCHNDGVEDLCVTNGNLDIYSALSFHNSGHQYNRYEKNITADGVRDKTSHKAYCLCGDYILEEHTTPVGATGNSANCTKCGEEVHIHNYNSYYTKYGTNNWANHKAYCSCGEYILEAHVAPNGLVVHTEAPCAKCGQIASFHHFTWTYYNRKNHIMACSCGEQHIKNAMPHIIARADIKNGRYAPCLDCGTVLDLLYDQALVIEV